MMEATTKTRRECGEVSLRVLLAVHGHEPAEWMTRACRLVSGLSHARVRVLAVFEVPCPPFTSLISPARRLYTAARSAWRQNEEQGVQGGVDRALLALSGHVEVVREESPPGGLGNTILGHALEWAADVVVVAAPARLALSWMWPGPMHERLLRHGGVAVLAIPAEPSSQGTGRLSSVPRGLLSRLRPAVATRLV